MDADAFEVIASLLDPRFKRAKFFPDPDDKKAAHSALLAMMKKETRRKEQPTTSQPTEDVQDLRPHTDQTEPTKKTMSLGHYWCRIQ